MIINKATLRRNMWSALLAFALLGCVLLWLDIYTFPENTSRITTLPNGTIDKSHIWYEKLILPFYFTFISNFMALTAGIMRSFGLFKHHQNRVERFETMMSVNLIITFVVYWALIFPGKEPATVLGWASNLTVHGIVPVLALFAFFIQHFNNKETIKQPVLKCSLQNLLFPLGWFAVALIIYYSLGGNKDAAIYSFLRFGQNKVWFSVAVVLGIAIAYFGITCLMTWLSNGNSKKSKTK